MILLNTFCTFPWWTYCILPFLLGLALGWALWAKYKKMLADLESDITRLNGKITSLEEDLSACHSRRSALDSELALANGRVRELDLKLMNFQKGEDSSANANLTAASLTSKSPENKPKKASKGAAGIKGYAALKEDNLQIIEGIGPKMNSILNDHSIVTWANLASKSPEDLRGILNEYGDRYRIIDPSTWSAQAALARDGKWEELITKQKQLDGGKAEGAINLTDSKLEKVMIKMGLLKRWKQDDLKAVEGIGPKIAGLLNNAGINTWAELADTEVSKIQKVLDDAGSRYSLADPATWPQQAALARDGKWEELEEFQDILQGGRQ